MAGSLALATCSAGSLVSATCKFPCGSLRPLFSLNQEESALSSNFSSSGGISLVSNSSSRGIGLVSNFYSSANSCRRQTLRQEESALETKYSVSRIRTEPDKNMIVLRWRRRRTLVVAELLSSANSCRRTQCRRTLGVGELLSSSHSCRRNLGVGELLS